MIESRRFRIMKEDSKMLYAWALMAACCSALFVSCEKTEKDAGNESVKIILSVDKNEISTGGEDVAVFTVTDGAGTDLTAESSVWQVPENGESGLQLDGSVFTAEEPGKYRFYATYEEAVSNEVMVTVWETEDTPAFGKLELVADKTEIAADDTDVVVFTVYGDGDDVTDMPGISVCMESGMCMVARDGKFTWSTDTPGEYVFTAGFGDLHSDPVTVTAR